MGVIHNVQKQAELEKHLLEANQKLVVVDFHAKWCGPCRQIAPTILKMAQTRDIIVLKVDVDDAPLLSERQNVIAMPTFKFFKQGRLVSEFSGADQQKFVYEVDRCI